jgi:diacylglycerol kinase (ATP)
VTRRIALLVNPVSGKGRGARLLAPVGDRLRSAGVDVDVDVIVGRDADEAFDLVRTVVAGDPGVDGVVAVGGDGLVNLAVQVVAGTAVPLGIIPAGSGNDVARALGIPRGDPLAAADLVLAGTTRAVDLGRADGRWFAGVLGSGFDSMVNERANRMSWPTGRSRYNLAILAELRVFRPVPFVLELDGERWETEAMLVAVGNGSSYGGGMRVCPDARLDDGLLDVTVLGPISKPEFLRVFPSVYKGTHVHHRAVTVRRARTVVLSSPGVTAYADGERVAALPVRCDAVPAALQVFS